jgi:hypothetical protein
MRPHLFLVYLLRLLLLELCAAMRPHSKMNRNKGSTRDLGVWWVPTRDLAVWWFPTRDLAVWWVPTRDLGVWWVPIRDLAVWWVPIRDLAVWLGAPPFLEMLSGIAWWVSTRDLVVWWVYNLGS